MVLSKSMKGRMILFGIVLLLVSIICLISSLVGNNKQEEQSDQITVQKIPVTAGVSSVIHQELETYYSQPRLIEVSTATTVNKDEYIKLQDRMSMDWDADDAYLLAKIAMAEAEGESTEIKALVILTALNRMLDNRFPSTIRDVIFEPKQFSPITNGRWDKVKPNEDCYKALELIYQGYDESQGCLYFEACSDEDNWHSRNLKFLFEIDGVRFYK